MIIVTVLSIKIIAGTGIRFGIIIIMRKIGVFMLLHGSIVTLI